MVAARRTRWSFALERAVEWAAAFGVPLVVYEPLRLDYQWASDRLHQFVLDGMAATRTAFAGRRGVAYFPWVEPTPGAGVGLLDALAANARIVVTDDYPAFMLPALAAAAASRLDVSVEAVDGNGLLPMRQPAGQVFPTAYAFRRHLQRTFASGMPTAPLADPLDGLPDLAPPVLDSITARYQSAADALLAGQSSVERLAIDHAVRPVETRGGSEAATRALDRFLDRTLVEYATERNHVEQDATSRLSAYLHFGHVSSWEAFTRLMAHEGWLGPASGRSSGAREGWWGVSPAAEAFLDQLVTWRELGFNMCVGRPDDYDRFESLPPWARATLDRHRADPRRHVYDLSAFERAATHDPLWNAAQGQLRREGRIHNYVRMLWGKKILEWSPTPDAALDVMIELNNKYAIDGRDPNSYSGIFWTLGRYDRPWAPEREVFGTVRYMSSENTARKMPVREYIRRFAPTPVPRLWTD
jgi:deoxyribodipyrimidine photo-lyase